MQEEDFCMWVVLNSGQRLFLLALQLNSETKFKLKKLFYYPSSFLQFCDLEWIPSSVSVRVWSWVENLFCCFEREIFWVEILWEINLSLKTGDHVAKKTNKKSQPAGAAAAAVGPFVDEKATRRYCSILCYGRRSPLIWWSSSFSWMQQECLSSSSPMNSYCFVVWFISSEKAIIHNRRRRRRNTFSVWCCCWLRLLALQTVAASWMWWWVSVGFILSPISGHPFASSQQICRFHVVGCCKSSATSRKRTRTLSAFCGCCGLWVVEV